MIILAIDPGCDQSGWVVWDGTAIRQHGIAPNLEVLNLVRTNLYMADVLVIEAMASYGMAVGAEVFRTVRFSGRLEEAWDPDPVAFLERRAIKLHLCHSARATDANIRTAILDRFGPGKDVAVGRKAHPGPLFGVKGHEYAALAVALTWSDTHGTQHG